VAEGVLLGSRAIASGLLPLMLEAVAHAAKNETMNNETMNNEK
jgi:hypothetical protein